MNVGFALCGSFCTFAKVFPVMELLSRDYSVTPIFSDAAYGTDTRFGKATDHIELAGEICGKPSIHTIVQAEPIGPRKLFDILLIAPCTGNTLAKLAHGIADGPVTMAAKSHLRNGRPVLSHSGRMIQKRSPEAWWLILAQYPRLWKPLWKDGNFSLLSYKRKDGIFPVLSTVYKFSASSIQIR